MNSRKLSQAADFSGGMTKSASSANDIVAAGRRVHENALFSHSPHCSLERFECSTLFAGDVWLRAGLLRFHFAWSCFTLSRKTWPTMARVLGLILSSESCGVCQ